MTTLSDLLYVAFFTVVGPLIDYSVTWPAIALHIVLDAAGGVTAWVGAAQRVCKRRRFGRN